MKRQILMVVVLATALLAVACSGGDKGDIAGRKVDVVATTGMIGDAATVIGGDRANVQTLMGPGVDPHLYKATAGDVSRLSNADIIFYNGLHLEGMMASVLAKMSEEIKTVAVAEAIPRDRLLSPAEYEGQHDPHVWFDVEMWMYAVQAIRDAYVELDPRHADEYNKNAEAYIADLTALHQEVRELAESVSLEKRVLITAHDAFNYFGRAYGFEVRGLQGISTASEAGAGDVQSLAAFIAERRIPAIFVESSIPARNLEAVQAAVKSKNFTVAIGGELFSDAMGTAGTPEGTYIGMVRHNVTTIVETLKQQ